MKTLGYMFVKEFGLNPNLLQHRVLMHNMAFGLFITKNDLAKKYTFTQTLWGFYSLKLNKEITKYRHLEGK
jgi:hypothetical protein